MKSTTVLYWMPRLLGVLAAGFLGLFALDVFGEQTTLWTTLQGLALHLIPAAIVLAALAIAWRREVPGGLLFIGLGVAYVLMTDARRHPDWVAIIAGPLWLIGALFLISHTVRRRAGSSSVRA